MKRVTLEAVTREPDGKGAARKLRRAGQVPAVLYGNELEGAISISIDDFVLKHVVKPHEAHNFIIDLKIGEETYPTIIKMIDQDPISENALHLDFYRISMDKPIQTDIPIVIIGSAPGIKEGGMVEHHLRELEISCLPLDLPDQITVDISWMELDDVFHVNRLELDEKITILTEDNETIVHVRLPKIYVEETDEDEEGLEEGEEGEEGEDSEESEE